MSTRAAEPPSLAPPPEPLFKPPGWSWHGFDGIGWWVRPEWAAILLGPDGLPLDDWRRDGLLTTIKTGTQRVVYRVDLPAGSFYIKHYLVPTWRETLRQWFRRGKGRNEGKRAARLAKIGVTTINPVALGEHRTRKFLFENYLITPAITDTIPLDTYVEEHLPRLPEPERSRTRRALAVELAGLTAKLHEAGFIHQDFHPGNVLVHSEPDDVPKLAMIDLDALRFRRRLSWADALTNLALLNHSFWLRCGRSDRHRFLRAYLDARRPPRPEPGRFAVRVEEATRAWAEKLWRRAGKRCRGENKYFATFEAPDAWAIAARDLGPEAVRALLDDPDAPFRDPAATLLKDSRTTSVAEWTLDVGGRPERVIYKRFNVKKQLDPWLNLIRPSRAWRSWQAGQHLASRGIPTPRNLAVIARLRPGRRWLPSHFAARETYLVTAKAEPAIALADYVKHVLPTLEPADCRDRVQRLSLALARLLRTLHERSLTHRDLKAANILIVGDPAAARPRLSLIDLVGVRLEAPVPRRRRLQNLARLQLSLAHVPGRTRTDALRFLRAYLPWAKTPRDDWKALWRAVAVACRKKQALNRRRGRALS